MNRCYASHVTRPRVTPWYVFISLLQVRFMLKREHPLHEASFTPTSQSWSTTTNLLPVKPDCQRGESEHSTATSLLPARPDCQRGEREPIRAVRQSISEDWKVNMSELCEWADQWWKWACQSRSGSEYVTVVRVSMSELWEWACWSHESQSVRLSE